MEKKKKIFLATLTKLRIIHFICLALGIFVIITIVALRFTIVPLEARAETDEIVILANELDDKILNILNVSFPDRTFQMETIGI